MGGQTETGDDPCALMVAILRSRYGFADEPVLEAMRRVRRDRFIPESGRLSADPFGDYPVQIGWGQTVSQPFIVACMTSWLLVRPGMRVLEIGTGSGYQAAILAELGAEVHTVERIPELADWARRVLVAEGYARVSVHLSDGYGGWPAAAPYEGILLACAPLSVPDTLFAQLAEGGRLVAPVGSEVQQLIRVRRCGSFLGEERGIGVRFVPMVPAGRPA